nr:hypothetical protein [Tanacetum cinerariifolium]GEX54771.1 hypothetical protein [Tanacetum cinerariifolium]
MLICHDPDMVYGLHPIRRISNESDLVVEINFTWSLGFGSVQPTMNLVSDSSNVCLRSGYEEFSLLRWYNPGPAALYYPEGVFSHFLDGYFCISSSFSGNDTFRVKDLSGQYAVLITHNTPYCLDEQIHRLDYRSQYDILSGKVDTSYPTGGYSVSVDLSKHDS